jgi:hypothetical protein
MLEESPPDKRPVKLSSRDQVNAGKQPINRKIKRRDMDLRQVHIYLLAPMDTSHRSPINNGEVQLGRQQAVNATLSCAGVHQSLNTFDSGNWHGPNTLFKCRIKSNVNKQSWPICSKQSGATRYTGDTIKSAFCLWHNKKAAPSYTPVIHQRCWQSYRGCAHLTH